MSSPESLENITGSSEVLEKLLQVGAIDFQTLSETLPEELGQTAKDDLAKAATKRIESILVSGHFRELQGAREFMARIGVEELIVSDALRLELNAMLLQLDERTVISLGMSQTGGIGEYNIEKAKEILLQRGLPAEQLSEERIKKILDYRHVLLALMRKDVKNLISGKELLEITEEL